MKRKAFITIICSVIAVAVVMIATLLIFLMTGVVTLDKDEVRISTSSATAEYTGKPLTNDEWNLISGSLKKGHKLEVTVTGSQTAVGMSENYAQAKIVDEDGKDVSDNYNITFELGLLKVTARPITITAGSDRKAYDGTPLTCPKWESSPNTALITGHKIEAVIEGSQTEIGTSPNRVTSVTITSANGTDVTMYYQITTKDGLLEVVEPDPVGGGGGGGGGIIGGGSGGERPDMTGDPEALFIINSDTAGPIYLKMASYGNYTGSLNWSNAIDYDTLILGGRASAFYLPSEAVKYTGARPANVTILSLCGIYVLPYYNYMGDESLQQSDCVISGITVNEAGEPEPYSVYYFTSLEGATLPDMYKSFEEAYSRFVHTQYLQIDDDTLAYMNTVIADAGFDRQNVDVAAVANYIRNAVYYDDYYDSALDSERNVVVSFLRDYKAGNYRHFASAATMLFRALGIPARYTEGFAGVIGEANTPTSIYGNRAHAWVEIYVDGFGWVCVEATGDLKNIQDKPLDPKDPSTFDPPVTPGPDKDPSGPILGKLPGVGNNSNGGGGGNGGNGGGSSGNLGGGAPEGDPVPLFSIVTDTSGNVYLKEQSYGKYTGTSFEEAEEYSETIVGERGAYYLVSYALKNGMLDVSTVNIDPLAEIFALPYYTQSGGGLQPSDVIMSGDATNPYTVKYYAWTGTSGVVIPEEYRAFEIAYRGFVKSQYLAIDNDTDLFMKDLTASLGFDASDADIIYKVANYIQNAAKYKLKYNPALDDESNMVIAFLADYKEGLCRHYAAAATMMFRSLGIPARYTVGYVAQGVKANEEYIVDSHMGHAWVEVYVDGIGWIMVEVTGSDDGDDDDQPIKLDNISPIYIAEKYEEGKILTHSNVVTKFEPLAKKGYSYVATVEGSLSAPGVTTTTITEFLIYDKNNELVYQKTTGLGSEKFILTFSSNTLQMYIDVLTFSSVSCVKEKIYDGSELSVEESECVLEKGELGAEYSYVITPIGKITNAGKASASFSVKVYKNGEDCTSHFYVIKNYGSLTITPKPIEISAKSAEKTFDGTSLVCDEIEYDASLLVLGEYVKEFEVEGSQKTIGQSANVLRSVVIVDAAGNVTTGNYEVKIIDGTLTVKRP